MPEPKDPIDQAIEAFREHRGGVAAGKVEAYLDAVQQGLCNACHNGMTDAETRAVTAQISLVSLIKRELFPPKREG